MPLAATRPASQRMSRLMEAMRLRIASPPRAMPRMKAESITSKAWVEAPSPIVSMRIQVIS